MRKLKGLLLAAAGATSLSGCLAPSYKVPAVATNLPATYKEVGPWTPAAPADAAPRGDWWTAFGDPTLNQLEAQLVAANPNLAQALHRYDESRAYFRQARAGLFPQVGLQAEAGPERLSADRLAGGGIAQKGDLNAVGGVFSYEVDLWGRVRNEVAAGRAEAQASAADLASTRLSLQAQLADAYLTLRSLDSQARVLDLAVQSYGKALDLTRVSHEGGAVSGMDVDQAETQLQLAKAAYTDVLASRALMEHAIASLVGVPATQFALPAAPQLPPLPPTPVSAPSLLLQRRPDVAAAERRTFEANRRIGVARAAFFPSIVLGGAGGFQTSTLAQSFLSAPATYWSLGPQLAMSIFDGGRRAAGVAAATAVYDQAADSYRATVLTAFQQVEDNLALLNHLAVEAQQERAAYEAAHRAEQLALIEYKQGAVTYLNVVTAQTYALSAERSVIAIEARRLQASVDLVRALGGGWDDREIAGTEHGGAPAAKGVDAHA